MSRWWVGGSALFWLLLTLYGVIGDNVSAQDVCEGARKELQQERQRLNEYESALRESYDKQDLNLAKVLDFKIGQARKKLRDLELIIKYCPHREADAPAGGLSGPKSDDGRYADKSCTELRKMLFPLLVNKRELERRQMSMLSGLTEDQQRKLLDVSDELRHVRKALRTRCSTGRRQRSLLKRLQR